MSSVSRTKGHKRKFAKDISTYFISQKVPTVWNSLLGHVVEAETLGVFETRLDTGLSGTL